MDYTIIERAEDLGPVAERVARAGVLGLDIETYDKRTGEGTFDPLVGDIRLVQLNLDDEADGVYVIDKLKCGTIDPLISALRDTKAVTVIHNAKFEQKWFKHLHNLELWPIFCSFRASALIYNGKKGMSHSVDAVTDRELGISMEKGQGASRWGDSLTPEQYEYAADDVRHLLKLRERLKRKLADNGLLRTALIEFGCLLPEAAIELNGLHLDADAWLALAEDNRLESRRLGDDLLLELPHPENLLALPGMIPHWNLGSHPQMLKSMHHLGCMVDNTAETTLSMQAAEYPVVAKVLKQRKVAKSVSTFGPAYPGKWIHPVTGRVHTNLYAMLASGRYSSSKPNLQQIPRDPRFRRCFRAAPGKRLVAADYGGIEMRIVCEISEDEALLEIFLTGQDAHYATASIVMDKPVEEVTKAERQFAKPVNFGLIYGMQPDKLVLYAMSGYGVAMSEKQAKKYHKRYFEKYQGIRRWHNRVMRDGRRTGMSYSMSGRLRHLDETAFNEFKNNPVQSTGADALKTAMPLVHKAIAPHGDSMKMVHIIHDEIILEVDDTPECVQAARTILHDEMKTAMEQFLKKVPVVVDPADGYTWADCK